MISVSNKYKAVFFHIPKTGGIYTEFILSEHYDFDMPSVSCRGECNKPIEVNNMPINSDLITNLERDFPEWKSYYKFTFIRNPYDRAISSYEYIMQKYNDSRIPKAIKEENVDFKSFYCNYKKYNLSSFINNHAFSSQYATLVNIKMDYYANFKNLNEEINIILQKIGVEDYNKHSYLLEENIKLNSTIKKDITSYYDNETLKIVNELFKEDFIHLGFEQMTTVDELNAFLVKYNS